MVAGFVAAVVIAAVVAARGSLAVTVLGLIVFGVLHNLLELRYVTGRFTAILSGRYLWFLLVLISGVVACRLLPLPPWNRLVEILLGYAVLASACVLALRRRPVVLAAASAVLLVATGTSLIWPAYHFVVLAHLHNLVPLVFLWEWSRRISGRGRAVFRFVQVAWVLVLPAVVLAGAVDRWLVADGAAWAVSFAGDPVRVAAPYVPPAWAAYGATDPIGPRFLVVFAFLQTMHYVVWVAFLPWAAPDAVRGFQARVPLLTGRRLWLAGAVAGGLLAVLLIGDWTSGRTAYSALASYHAYLEFPVLLAVLFAAPAWSTATAPQTITRPPRTLRAHARPGHR